jgi:hypothetical protein
MQEHREGGHPVAVALREDNMASLLWLVFAVLLVLWLVGFAVNWGAFIWILLIAALVALAVNLFSGSRTGRWY